MNFWLSAGHPENWKMAIEQGGIWGVKPERKKCWEKISRGDIIAFYVTYPVSGVIGFGVVTRKFHDDKTLVWPDEKKQGKAIWTYRWRFDIKYKLAEDVWKEKKIPILGRWGGLNCIKTKTSRSNFCNRQTFPGIRI